MTATPFHARWGGTPGLADAVESGEAALYLRPLGLGDGTGALRLAGGPLWFDRVELAVRRTAAPGAIERAVGSLAELKAWAAGQGLGDPIAARLEALTRPRPPLAGLAFDRPLIMGIVNVTSDSFSDGSDHLDPAQAIAHGHALRAAGADILDVGGESTRPGAEPVAPEEEQRRVLPVVRALAEAGAVVSIDTRHAATMAAALDAGAQIINDVTALTGDSDSLAVAARARVPVVLMHMQGEPRTMQQEPRYADAPLDIFDWLEARIAACAAAGLPRERLVADPGIGFGKTVQHNLDLLRHLALFHGLGVPLLVGVSRKAFIGRLSRQEPPRQRLPGSLAAGLAALDRGAQILRVHDVAETSQARAIWQALLRSG